VIHKVYQLRMVFVALGIIVRAVLKVPLPRKVPQRTFVLWEDIVKQVLSILVFVPLALTALQLAYKTPLNAQIVLPVSTVQQLG